MAGVEQFNLGGGASPASPEDVYPLMERMIASMDSSAERIGRNIRQSMAQDQMNNQGKALAQEAQGIDPTKPGAIQQLIGLAGKYPMGAQSPAGQMALQYLGSAAANVAPIAPNPVTGDTGAPAQRGGAQPTSGSTIATSFATPADQKLAAQTGGKQGDSGTGAWGNYTGQGSGPQVSFPEATLKGWFGDDWKKKAYGQPVTVYANGKRVQARIGDMGPAKWTGAGMDLNPDATSALGIDDPDKFKGGVSYAVGGRVSNITPSFSKPTQQPQAQSQDQPSPVAVLGAQLQQVAGQADVIRNSIARMGPVTGRNRSVVFAMTRQLQSAQTQADTLTERMATAQEAQTRESREQKSDDEREQDRKEKEADRQAAQAETAKKNAQEQVDKEDNIKRLQQAQTDKEKKDAQDAIDKKIRIAMADRESIQKQQAPLLKSITNKETKLRNLSDDAIKNKKSDPLVTALQADLAPDYIKKGQLENDLQRVSQTIDQYNAGMTATEYQQSIANAKAAIAKNPAARATVIAGLEDAGITHSGL